MMTEEEMQVAITSKLKWLEQGDGFWRRPDGQTVERCPDFLSDINAMHTAVSSLRPEDANQWVSKLCGIVAFGANPHWNRDYHLANSTALQRSEAFCRVMFPERWEK